MITANYYIGWDVGGWNCDRNANSRDAIVILDDDLSVIGSLWRGNLRDAINSAESSRHWKNALFALCGKVLPESAKITLAIDTPLGFSDEFCRLVTDFQCSEPIGEFRENPYLFRQTERFLHQNGLRPLSAVQDQIGSQATKGMHVLAKFAPERVACGVWSDGDGLTAIEAYPSACKESDTVQKLADKYSDLGHQDKNDALICALVGYLFEEKRELLASPLPGIPECEGWIWVPKDGLNHSREL